MSQRLFLRREFEIEYMRLMRSLQSSGRWNAALEDILQDVTIDIMTKDAAGLLGHVANPKWFFERAVWNRRLNVGRGDWRRRPREMTHGDISGSLPCSIEESELVDFLEDQSFSPLEEAVLVCLLQGMSNCEIAEQLGLRPQAIADLLRRHLRPKLRSLLTRRDRKAA